MKYNELNITRNTTAKRVGRGIAAGSGKTAGRGTKGQNARSGSSKRPGFEGGQNPLMQRLPKLRGFRSLKSAAEIVHTGQLEAFENKTINPTFLAEQGLISSPYVNVKLLNRGELTKKVTVTLQKASAAAIETVQKAGGSFEQIPRQPRPVTSTKKSQQ